ncbi:putative High mobility group protein HMGA [Lupinus albus]|uniref:Putative High mobility group protein HMGA n=1 Tax=Lupinus albus TaxID=3870 RepID=A0A6A4QJN2_LUPAL|nr:putative High mobility group protein HMGA [Lupinus albus]
MALPPSSPPASTNVAFPFDNNNYIYDPASANFKNNSLPNNPPALPSQPRNHNHPSYAEMIYTAIGALKEKNGSSKRAICKYMEQVYKDNLPPNHDALLTKNLKSLKKNGHLVLVKKSYHLPLGSIQPHSEPEQVQQVAQSEHKANPKPAQNANTNGGGGVTEVKKRGRGRPPRVSSLKPQAKPADSVVKPKPRGRPRKNAAVTASSAAAGGANKKLAVAGKKSMKKSSAKPVGRPEVIFLTYFNAFCFASFNQISSIFAFMFY